MFITVLALSFALLTIAMFGFGVKIIFSKEKKFPDSRIGHNKTLRKKGIHCPITQQKLIDRNYKVKQKDVSCTSCDY